MGHRKHRYHPLVLIGRPVDLAELDCRAEVPVSQHHTFRVSSGSGCVINNRQVVPVVGRIDHIFRTEAIRIFLSEQVVDIVPNAYDGRISAIQDLQVIHIHHEPDSRGLGQIQLVKLVSVRQKGHTVRMIQQEFHVLRCEIREDRHNYSLESVDGEIRHAPTGAVTGP